MTLLLSKLNLLLGFSKLKCLLMQSYNAFDTYDIIKLSYVIKEKRINKFRVVVIHRSNLFSPFSTFF